MDNKECSIASSCLSSYDKTAHKFKWVSARLSTLSKFNSIFKAEIR